MTAEQPRTVPPDAGGSTLTRRTMLKATAGAGAVGAVGSGSLDALDPVGEAEAIPPVAIGAAAAGVGYAAGVYVSEFFSETQDVDHSQVIEDQIYQSVSAAVSTQDHTEEWDLFINRSEQATPYANTAWSEIRTAVAKARVNGKTETEAFAKAQTALDAQTARSVANLAGSWSAFLKASLPSIATDIEYSSGTLQAKGYDNLNSTWWTGSLKSPISSDVDAIATDMNTTVEVISADVPDSSDQSQTVTVDALTKYPLPDMVPALNDPNGILEERYLREVALSSANPAGIVGTIYISPFAEEFAEDVSYDIFNSTNLGGGNGGTSHGEILLNHSTYDTLIAYETKKLHSVYQVIESAYNTISGDLSTYVSNLYAAFAEGAVDPQSIIGPSELYSQFATADEQQRLTAELIAVGASVPKEQISLQAKVSHPDLVADSKWGVFYPIWAEGTTSRDVTPGTIPSADYDMAYLGFPAADTGEWTTRTLSGSSDLQVLDIEPTGESITVPEPPDAAGTNGAVEVWNPDVDGEIPDPIKYPKDHADWSAIVVGATDTVSAPLTDLVKQDDGTYTLESSALPEGQAIEEIRVQPNPTYTQASEPVTDPTTVDSQTVEDRATIYADLLEQIEALEDDGGGGGLFDFGGGGLFDFSVDLPSIPGLTAAQSAIVAVLGLAGLSAVTS